MEVSTHGNTYFVSAYVGLCGTSGTRRGDYLRYRGTDDDDDDDDERVHTLLTRSLPRDVSHKPFGKKPW